ncbi:MAG: hypothetical protein KBA71_11615 [Opitutaceae bacterium]|nr:hypothetical protein [Opitutaceae bacterium]
MSASDLVAPWLTQPGIAGHSATHAPLSSRPSAPEGKTGSGCGYPNCLLAQRVLLEEKEKRSVAKHQSTVPRQCSDLCLIDWGNHMGCSRVNNDRVLI